MRLHKIQVEKISSCFYLSMLSITFDNYLLCIKFSQLDLFTEVYHTCILYISVQINTLFELIFNLQFGA